MKLKTDKDEKTIARVECLSSSLQEFSPRVVSIVATRARPWTSSSAGKTHTKEERKTAPYLKNKQTSQPSPHKTSPKEEIKQSFISGHEKRLQKSRRRNQVRSVGVVWRRELPALQGNQSEQSKEVESEYQRAWAAVQAQEREAQGVQQLWIADQGRASQNSQIASQHNSLGTPRNVSPSPPVSNQHTSTPVTRPVDRPITNTPTDTAILTSLNLIGNVSKSSGISPNLISSVAAVNRTFGKPDQQVALGVVNNTQLLIDSSINTNASKNVFRPNSTNVDPAAFTIQTSGVSIPTVIAILLPALAGMLLFTTFLYWHWLKRNRAAGNSSSNLPRSKNMSSVLESGNAQITAVGSNKSICVKKGLSTLGSRTDFNFSPISTANTNNNCVSMVPSERPTFTIASASAVNFQEIPLPSLPTNFDESDAEVVGGGTNADNENKEGTPCNKTCIVKRSFQSNLADELLIAPGDRIRVEILFDDGWCYGENLDISRHHVPGFPEPAKSGALPQDCLSGIPGEDSGLDYELGNVFETVQNMSRSGRVTSTEESSSTSHPNRNSSLYLELPQKIMEEVGVNALGPVVK